MWGPEREIRGTTAVSAPSQPTRTSLLAEHVRVDWAPPGEHRPDGPGPGPASESESGRSWFCPQRAPNPWRASTRRSCSPHGMILCSKPDFEGANPALPTDRRKEARAKLGGWIRVNVPYSIGLPGGSEWGGGSLLRAPRRGRWPWLCADRSARRAGYRAGRATPHRHRPPVPPPRLNRRKRTAVPLPTARPAGPIPAARATASAAAAASARGP
jgi:hypothetical protein